MRCLLINMLLLMSLHPVHVTMTSVDYKSDAENVKVHVMMYYDDFLLDYKLFDPLSDISSYSDGNFPDSMMANYMMARLHIMVDGENLTGELTNMSLEYNEMNVDFVYKSKKRGETMTVRNELSVGLYDDQANMTIVSVDNLEEGVQFTPNYVEKKYMVK